MSLGAQWLAWRTVHCRADNVPFQLGRAMTGHPITVYRRQSSPAMQRDLPEAAYRIPQETSVSGYVANA